LSSVTRPGTWGDVFVLSNGVIGCGYDTVTGIKIEYYSLNNKDEPVKIDEDFIELGERPLFTRVDKNNDGHILGMGQGAVTGKFLIKSIGGNYPDPNKSTYGTNVCDLVPTSDGFRYIVQVSASHYYDSALNTEFPLPGIIWGTSQGIIQLLDGPVWSDLERTAVPEMLYPFDQLGIKVGEGRTDPAHIQALESGKQKNIYNGIAERPRCCYNGQSNIFAISSRSPQGVTFNFLRLPLPDINVTPIPEPESEPEPQPMSLPDKVIATLDRFFAAKCGHYDDGSLAPPQGEDNVRELIIDADEQVAFEHPNQGYGTKRADAGRPVSKDSLAQKKDNKLFIWDLVSGAGTTHPTFVYKNASSQDVTGQIYIGPGDPLDGGAKFTPQNHLSGTTPVPIPPTSTPPVDCKPVVPPQDVIRDSLNILRNFCQTYIAPPDSLPQYANTKPYINDEIHMNGLYIGDGLIYFMMSDTGLWAQVLMDPTDKSDWSTKRQKADLALQSYMKKRVGDNS
jgi:hypothetical protein